MRKKSRNKPVLLGSALLYWRVARWPESGHSPNSCELELAHQSAHELCCYALDVVTSSESQSLRDYWIEVYCVSISTLSAFGTESSLAQLQKLSERVKNMQPVDMEYRTLLSLLAFPASRFCSLERLLELEAPKALIGSRDLLLEGLLDDPQPINDPETNQGEIARLVHSRSIKYSSKAFARRIVSRIDYWLSSE